MGSFDHVFEPLRIGSLTAKNRIECSPAIPFLASEDFFVTRELIEWYRRIAQGGAGVVTIGETSIDYEDAHKHGRLNVLCLADSRSVNGLSVLVETIHRYDAIASIELNYEGLSSPTDMSAEEIKAVIDRFADAALRCKQAGLGMIMIHGGHGHLVGSFFSPATNRRSDSYGGDLRKRSRFAIEVLEAIRAKIGDDVALEYRISADELVPGAATVDETIEFTTMIEDKIDLLHVSAGNLYVQETSPRMIQPIYVPRGINVDYAARFKQALKIPVATVGSLTMDMAEEIIARNRADMVAMIRTIIADPDCVKKAREGRADDIRPCVRCNRCLSDTREYTRPTRCAVNSVAGREVEFLSQPAAGAKRKVVVIGGGAGGMEAARTAAGRGHHVVMFEKDSQLGGALTAASSPPFKEDMKKYLDWARRTAAKTSNIDIRLSTEATPEVVSAESPDVLVIAVGGSPAVPPVPGIDRENVVWAGDVDSGRVEAGSTVVVVGAGLMGCETALHLAQTGRRVTVIDALPLEQIASDVHPISRTALLDMLQGALVEMKTETALEAVIGAGAVVRGADGERSEIPCDSVVLAAGVMPRSDLVERFKGLADEVRVIGDCRRERGDLRYAITDGFNAAIDI